ncbi:MAG: 2-dehydropantoate 2-reductase N-terminal domain-containing protein, partial [Gemmatimonadales bacterium]
MGAGSWGTALADLLARKGLGVTLWAREPEVVDSINRQHVNSVFLPGAPLAPSLAASGALAEAVRGALVVVSAAPSHAVRAVMTSAAAAVGERALVVSVSKGLEGGTLKTMSRVLADVLGPRVTPAVLSGPSFAQEV